MHITSRSQAYAARLSSPFLFFGDRFHSLSNSAWSSVRARRVAALPGIPLGRPVLSAPCVPLQWGKSVQPKKGPYWLLRRTIVPLQSGHSSVLVPWDFDGPGGVRVCLSSAECWPELAASLRSRAFCRSVRGFCAIGLYLAFCGSCRCGRSYLRRPESVGVAE